MKHPVPLPAPPAVPRLGPPTNLRPAGFHADRRRETRAAAKAALKKAAFDVLEREHAARARRPEKRDAPARGRLFDSCCGATSRRDPQVANDAGRARR